MLLIAFYKNMTACLTNQKLTAVTTTGSSATSSSDTYDDYRFKFTDLKTIATKKTDTSGVVFGTSDTPPSFNDYFLKGEMITCLSGSGALTVEEDDTGVTYTSVFTVTNTSDAEVTVKEIGYISSYSICVMYDRTVLDEPLTIPAGGIGQVTYTIRMNYPTA